MDPTNIEEAVARMEALAPRAEPQPPEYVDEQDDSIRTGWRIENMQSAEWALKRQAECEEEIAQIEVDAERAREWIERRRKALVAKAERGVFFFRAHLLDWMERNRHELVKGKKKSRALLYGSLGWKAAPKKLVYDDEAAALDWAKAQDVTLGLYRVDYRIEKDAVKRYAEAHNLVPPGTRWEGGEDRPFVKAISPTNLLEDKTHAAE